MAPHYQLLQDALADGGHLDVIFTDISGWLETAAKYLQQINAALGGPDIPLYASTAAANIAAASGVSTGLVGDRAYYAAASGAPGNEAERARIYANADAYGKAMMDFQASHLISGGGTSQFHSGNPFGVTAEQYDAGVEAGYMADLGLRGSGMVYKYNAATGMVEEVGNVSDLLPGASGGGDFSGPESGYLVQLHGKERVKKTPLSPRQKHPAKPSSFISTSAPMIRPLNPPFKT